jgi:proteasome accessory factor B
MPDPEERLVNLALLLGAAARPVSAAECRAAGIGYPEGQDEAAFLRMFERDKDVLRGCGLAIEVEKDSDGERYVLDRSATYAAEVTLTPEESAAVRTAAAALAGDASFPFADDLTVALTKLGWAADERPAYSEAVDENPDVQVQAARLLASAASARKIVTFGYTNARGEHKEHEVEPYALFFREGRWYLVARDRDLGEIRVYALRRMDGCAVNPSAPKTPDFTVPEGFSVDEYARLPFQYGREHIEARVRFAPDEARRAERLAAGEGVLAGLPDGSAEWRVEASNADALASWCVEHGPGIVPIGPDAAVSAFRTGLQEVCERHGC